MIRRMLMERAGDPVSLMDNPGPVDPVLLVTPTEANPIPPEAVISPDSKVPHLTYEEGDFMEMIDDPMNAGTKYAVFYKKVPTRAVVMEASPGTPDLVKGSQLSMTEIPDVFRRVGAAFIRRVEDEAKAEADATLSMQSRNGMRRGA
jgi:hypothetical protein